METYVTCNLKQRTGNLMFQIAHGYSQALRNKRRFILPSNVESSLHLQKNLFRYFDFGLESLPDIKYTESTFEYQELAINENSPTVFDGWFQSEKFFEPHKEVIKNLFYPPAHFINNVKEDLPFLFNHTTLAINVRRGDYLYKPGGHPVITMDYINEALKHVPKCERVLVMSDDIGWCKENIHLDNVYFNEKYWDHEGIWLLSLCDHFIISNSSFSWWGAYLSKTPYKTVVCPDTWFGPEIPVNTKDLFCPDWIRIPTRWQDGFLILGDI